jgi:hypothetical protein
MVASSLVSPMADFPCRIIAAATLSMIDQRIGAQCPFLPEAGGVIER